MRVRVPLITFLVVAVLETAASAGAAAQVFDMTGSLIAVSLDSGDFTYNGSLIPDVKKPGVQGAAVLIGCNTNTTFVAGDHSSEIMNAKVKTKANSDKASFSALSIFEINDAQFGESVETCKLSYKRVSSSPPAPPIAGCGP